MTRDGASNSRNSERNGRRMKDGDGEAEKTWGRAQRETDGESREKG